MDENIKKYFSEIGRKGGSVRSEKKTVSSRNNGRLGGRPKGSKNKDKVSNDTEE